ncbi:MAG: ABC transporter permease [Gammaproteobacteria bacterium]|nr:ABC transporter permease [Gammaproteobacteria bacterium]
MHSIDSLGRWAIDRALYFVYLSAFILRAVRGWSSIGAPAKYAFSGSLLNQFIFTGIDTLPAITLLGAVVAMGVTSEIIVLLGDVSSAADVSRALVTVMVNEFSVLLTAIVLIGRVGSAITVDLGGMQLRKEIESLELLGIHASTFFVTPRLIAVAVSQLMLAVYFSGIAVLGGILFSGFFISNRYFGYMEPLLSTFEGPLIAIFILKNLMFGLIIGSTACFHGFRVRHSPTELPQQTQSAMINALVMIFILDGLIVAATR